MADERTRPDRSRHEQDQTSSESRENRGPSSGESREDRISRRAYERFRERGGEHGHDEEDWLEAERETEE